MTAADRMRALAALLEGTSIGLLELTGPDGVVRLRRDGSAPSAAAIMEDSQRVVASPSVGTFRDRHPLEGEPLARPGDHVEAGAVVGLIQVGPLLLHVRAPVAGMVAAVVAQDGDLVGYGTPLFRLAEAPS